MNSTTTTTNKTSTSLTNKTNAKTSDRIKKAMMSKHKPTHTARCDCNGLPSLLHSLPIVTSSSASTSTSSIFDINEHYSSLEKLLDDDDDVKDENTLLPASLSKGLYRLSTATLVPAAEAKPILTSSKKRNVRFVCDHDESTNKHHQYSSSSLATSAANNNNNNNKQDKNIDKNRKKQKRRKVQRRNSVVIRDVAQLSRITDLMKN
jgi:hypothetical protein